MECTGIWRRSLPQRKISLSKIYGSARRQEVMERCGWADRKSGLGFCRPMGGTGGTARGPFQRGRGAMVIQIGNKVSRMTTGAQDRKVIYRWDISIRSAGMM